MSIVGTSRWGVILIVLCVLVMGAATAVAEPITIDYTVWGGGELEAPVITAFEAEYPNIKINFTAGGDIGPYIDKLLVMSAGGNAPDVFGVNVPNSERFYSSGTALPLDSLVTRDRVNLNAFLPGSFSYAKYNGALYGFPRGTRGAPFGAQMIAHNRTSQKHLDVRYSHRNGQKTNA